MTYQHLSPPHLLLIEDDDVQRSLYNRILTRQGYRVKVCGNGQEALAEDWTKYDVIVIDYLMPGITGGSVIHRKLEEHGELPPVIIFTCLDLMTVESLLPPPVKKMGLQVQLKVGTQSSVISSLMGAVRRVLTDNRTTV